MEQKGTLQDAFNVVGNAPDPDGTGARGVAPGYELASSALGHPELIFQTRDGLREVTLLADCFEDHIHLHCPLCRLDGHEHGVMIRKGVKEWLYEPMAHAPPFPGWEAARMLVTYPKGTGGRLQLAPVPCPWCKRTFAIDNNVVRIV